MRTTAVAAAAILAVQSAAYPFVSHEKLPNIQRRIVDLEKFRLNTKADYVPTKGQPTNIRSISK
jgi:hypothetical protein